MQNQLIKRFVTLSDMALQLTTPIAAAVIADVLAARKCAIDGVGRYGLAAMVRDAVPDGWLARHFPASVGREKHDRVASIDDVLRSRHVAHATKSYLLAMAALWQNPDDAMRECLAGAQGGAEGFDLAGGERALAAVMGGMSIKSACKAEGIHLRDFEQALRQVAGTKANTVILGS